MKAVSTTLKEVKSVPSFIIENLKESRENDTAKRHSHDLELVESVIRNVLPEKVLNYVLLKLKD